MTGSPPALFRRFPANTLPWVVAACAVVVFSLTLNPWISFSSVHQVARLSGWLWEPDMSGPLYFLATLPLRALPEPWIPAALNLFNALCAAATLGLLVRTVAILPHNRTHEQRIRGGLEGLPLSFRSAWLPPALAAAVCGLQLTFWEHATAGTPEMLDLLLFAYVIRCLLEFRLDGRHGWLWQTAFLGGVGMANNYAIVGFLPIYVIALIWLKRLKFFNGRFLLRMFLWGLLGTLLYLLMPLLQSQNADVPIGFWQSLKHTLASQKNVIASFPKKTLLLLSLTSLVPILLISIRWPQSFGDLSPQGAKFSSFIIHILHAAFLVTCIWIAFDPAVSPRNAGLGLPFLTFYYLATIAIGYFVGYFLLVFGRASDALSQNYDYARTRPSPLRKLLVAGIWTLAAAATVGLTLRNLPQVRLTNSSMLRDYATLIADEIPGGNTVILSDDPAREFVLRSALLQRGDRPDVILLNTGSLRWPQYHRMMAGRFPNRWPVEPPTNMQARVLDRSLVNLMLQFSKENQMCYAHPSFGYYFEYFQVQPAGILSLLNPYPEGELLSEPLTSDIVERNEEFWNESAARLLVSVVQGIKRGNTAGPVDARNPLLQKLHLEDEQNRTARIIGGWLSRSLNAYAVQAQRSGYLQEAGKQFERAVRFNPDSVAAAVNLQFNEDQVAERPSTVSTTIESIEKDTGHHRGTAGEILQQVMNSDGLFDEPRLTMDAAKIFLNGRLFRQSLSEFNRVRQLLPNHFAPQVWTARMFSMMGAPEQALGIVESVRAEPQRFELTSTSYMQLLFIEATVSLTQNDPDRAVRIVEAAISDTPNNTNLVTAALQLFMKAKLFTNSLSLIDRQLMLRPDDVNLLVNKGFVLLRMTNQAPAVDVLTRALELQSDNSPARVNRAIANLQLDNLDAAQHDYETLLLQFPNAHPIYYGLGEIAFRRSNTNQAIYNYRLYLSNAPPNTLEAQTVRERLETLSGTTP